MPVFAVVEDVLPGRAEARARESASLRARQRQALARFEVVAVDPGRLDFLSGFVHVRAVDQPAPVGVQVAAAQEVIGVGFGERLHHAGRVEIDAKEAIALVAVVILRDEHGAAVWRPRSQEDILIALGQAGSGAAIRRLARRRHRPSRRRPSRPRRPNAHRARHARPRVRARSAGHRADQSVMALLLRRRIQAAHVSPVARPRRAPGRFRGSGRSRSGQRG